MSSPAPEYYIEAGVRRAVAFRENGLRMIPAILHEPGRPSRSVWVQLDQLYSHRRSISRSDSRHNYDELERVLGTVLGRQQVPPIELQPLGLPGQPSTIPLAQVIIEA